MRVNNIERVPSNDIDTKQNEIDRSLLGDDANDNNLQISWLRSHFAWVLPSNLGRSRFSYAKKLDLEINDNDDDDEKEIIMFKPWLNRSRKKKKFTEIYNGLKNGISWIENKSFSDYLLILLQCIIFLLLLPFLIVLMIIIYGYIIITSIIWPFIFSCFNSKYQDSDISIVGDKEIGLRLTTKGSTMQSLRFSVYRLFQYGYWVTIHLFRVLSRTLAGRQRIPLVHDDVLIVYMHSNQHTKFEYDLDGNIIAGYIDNSDIIQTAEHQLFPGRYFPVKRIHLDYKTNVLSFTINNGSNSDKIISNKPGDCSERVWNSVKASYMTQRCLMDTLTHSWVHFHFNDIANKYMYSFFGNNPSTVLGRLLHSHFIYTSNVNMAGAGDAPNQPQIKGDHDSLLNTLNPLKINPINLEGFLSVIFMRIAKHYFKEEENEQDESSKQYELNQDMFPPREVKDRLKIFNKDYNKIRGYSLYWDMCSDYYLSVYQFIVKLNENNLIEMGDLRDFIALIDNDGMSGLSKCDELHVLATLIWTNGYIHGTDHITYGNVFRNYPFFGCYNNLDGISSDNQDIDISYKSILYSWKSMWISFKSEIFITSFTIPQKSCLNCISDYSSSPYLYRKFKNIPSLKSGNKLALINDIHNNYLHSLYRVNDDYEWMMHLNQIDASISY